ncbi:MAG: ABC transporter permease subunit [Rhizobiaceae bacterium]
MNGQSHVAAQSGSIAPASATVFERLGLDGPLTIFGGPVYWLLFVLALAAALLFPLYGSVFAALNFTSFLINVPLALGLALLWGYCGVLSFGQVAFFGIAGYAYGVMAINWGMGSATLLAAFCALGLTALVAAAFGYFLFYGRVSGWIVPVLTLVFTLVLETFLGQTAGMEWKIGEAPLGGFNGMTNIPSLTAGTISFDGFSLPLFYLVIILVAGILVGLRMLANSHFGHVIMAIQEDPERAELLGYDIRRYQLVVFTIAGFLAGLSGVLYATWGNFIQPSSVGLLAATFPVLWAAVGGRRSLTSVLIGTIALASLSDALAVYSGELAFVVMGALLLFGMMAAPDGIVITILRFLTRLVGRKSR